MITKHLKPILLITMTASLIVGSSGAIPAPLQADAPTKGGTTRKTQQRPPEEGKPSPDVIGYWQALAARSKEPLAISWNQRTGTPQSIMGKLSAPISGASEMAARSFLVGNAPLFKMSGDTSDLELVRAYESVLGQHFVFEQRYQGVLVYGAQVAVHFNRSGEIVTVNNTYEPDIALKVVKPQLSRANAIARAVGMFKGASGPPANELVVLGFNNSFSLAWRIVVPTQGPTWETFVDAEDGK